MAQLETSAITGLPETAAIALGGTLQLSAVATGQMSDGSQIPLGVQYQTDCPDIATVSATGLVPASSGTYFVPYFTGGGSVAISATALRPGVGNGPIGPPAQCLVTVLGAGSAERTGKKV